MSNKATQFNSETGRKAGKKMALPEVQEKKRRTEQTNRLIKGELFNTIREILLNPTEKSQDPYYQEFLKKFTKIGLEKPTSQAGMMIAEQLLRDGVVDALDEQTDKAE